jgi:hypothetical protein
MKSNLKKNKNFKVVFIFSLIFFSLVISSCNKSSGAICNDGHRSYSTGRGTCSWHGGVKYYIDENDLSIPKTLGLAVFFVFLGKMVIGKNKRN